MTHITLKPSGLSFQARPSQTVLEAAIEAGINMPYGCRNGACGSCKAKLLSGQVMHDDYQRGAMTDEELNAGFALCCKARALGDLTLECRAALGNQSKARILPVRIQQKNLLNDDVLQLHLQLPGSEKLAFLPGQYLEFILKDGQRRAYSIANAPHDDATIELHLRYVEGGQFSQHIFNELQEKAILRIEAPFGQCYLREESAKPLLFVAGGTGFAPIKSMIEHLIFTQSPRPMLLYRGARTLADMYQHDLCEKWAQMLPNLKYVPVLTAPKTTDNWQDRTGLVHQAVLDDLADLSGYQAYVCGAPAMVEAAQTSFAAHGLSADEFFADAFTFAPKVG